MDKFTPGPWFSKRDGYSTVYIEARIGGGWVQEVAACGPTEDGPEQQEANARLIASAPDLLEALEQSFDFPADFFECEEADAVTITVTGRNLSMVKAAIAKARGKS